MAFDSGNPLFSADDFDHKTPLVMVDDFIMFPRLMAACCIRKQSQIDLVETALQTNHLISLGVTALPVDVACLCRIVAMQRDPKGHLHLLLMGLHRVRIGVPVALNKLRGVRPAEICDEDEEANNSVDPDELMQLRQLLGCVARDIFAIAGVPDEITDQFKSLVSNQHVPLGSVCDLLASMLEIGHAEKGIILAEVDVMRRSRHLLSSMAKLVVKHQISQQAERQTATQTPYPAKFSFN